MRRPLLLLCNILILFCHSFWPLSAQEVQSESTSRPFLTARFSIPTVNAPEVCVQDAQTPPQSPDTARILADTQEKTGNLYHLRGRVEILYKDTHLTADQADYNDETQEATALGHVHIERPSRHEDIHAARVVYNLDTGAGQFYDVQGSTGARVGGKNVVLTTTNPFYFEARWAEKVDDNTYVIHHGYVTSCKPSSALWTLHSSRSVVLPDDHASIYDAWLHIRKVPVFFFPFFRHSLQRIPRSSGFLTPHLGTSSRKGFVAGESFYWAINRSADARLGFRVTCTDTDPVCGAGYNSARGWAQNAPFRYKPMEKTYLDASYFGVIDRGQVVNGARGPDQSGRTLTILGASELPYGFRAVANVNYLSSYQFRLAFTETFNEAIGSEVHTVTFVTKHFSSYDFHFAFSRYQNFQSTTPHDSIEIRALPSIQFSGADRRLFPRFPLYYSFDSAAEGLSRSEPSLETAGFISRFDLSQRFSLPLHLGDFRLTPSFGFRTTHYGSSLQTVGATTSGLIRGVSPNEINRITEEFTLDLRAPSLAKVFRSPWKSLGDRWKHVIEPSAVFRMRNGVDDFQQTLRFDFWHLRANTQGLQYSPTQPLYSHRAKDGEVRELASWEISQLYFFDPTFGGSLTPGQRNVFDSSIYLTGQAFLDTTRRFSPITSLMRVKPTNFYDLEVRSEYDPDRHRFVDTGVSANARHGKVFGSLGQTFVRSSPILASPSNQLRASVGYGGSSQLGPNIIWLLVDDVRNGFLQYSAVQASYNLDCCGLTVEWRRFAFGRARNENQWRVAVSFANIGTFGNIKKRERLF